MLKIVGDLIRLLDEKEVNYVHFKSNEHIDESVVGKTDFDILVDRRSAAAYEAVLRSLDCKRFRSPKGSVYPAVDDWLGMDSETGTFIHLHTHFQLITGKSGFKNYVLPWGRIALDSRKKDPETGLYFPAPEFELIELYTRIPAKISLRKDLRAMLKGYSLKGGTLREAQWLWQRVDKDALGEMLIRCFGSMAQSISADLFFKEHFTAGEYRHWRSRMLSVLNLHQRGGMEAVNLRSNIHKLRIKILGKLKKLRFTPGYQQKKFCHTGGLIIAFLGVDGSGKTTVTTSIHSWLSWKIETSLMALGVGRRKQSAMYKLKQKIKALLGKKSSPKGQGKTKEEPIPRTWKNYRKQAYMVRFAKQINRDIRRIHGYRLNGGIMITDRYPQLDYFGIADGPKVNQAFPKLQRQERKSLGIVREIQPDLVFKLMVPVEVSIQRRPEDPVESLQRKYEILKNITYSNAEVIEVDATRPLEEELLFIKKKIWEHL